jgi:DNA-binding ferritin-like protein
MSKEILHAFLVLRNQVKLYHWQTRSYGRHKATDDLVASLDANIDKFTEAYMGRYGQPKMTSATGKIQIYDTTDKRAPELLVEAVHWMTKSLPKYLSKHDTDLLNIRDEILADLQQARFLFTLSG